MHAFVSINQICIMIQAPMSSERFHAGMVAAVVEGNEVSVQDEVGKFISRSWSRCLLDNRLLPTTGRRLEVFENNRLREVKERHELLMDIAQLEMRNLYQQTLYLLHRWEII